VHPPFTPFDRHRRESSAADRDTASRKRLIIDISQPTLNNLRYQHHPIDMTVADLEHLSTSELRTSVEPVSIPSAAPEAEFTNWAKTFRCRPQRVFAPTTVEQCRAIMELARREGARLHPVGVGHSPSDLACTNGWLLRMEGIKGFIGVSCFLDQGFLTIADDPRQTPSRALLPSTVERHYTTCIAVFNHALLLWRYATLARSRIRLSVD